MSAMTHRFGTPAQEKGTLQLEKDVNTPAPKPKSLLSGLKNLDPLTPGGTATPGSSLATATPSPATHPLTGGSLLSYDDPLQVAINLAQTGETEEALTVLRCRCPQASSGPEVAAARHAVIEALLSQENLQAACELALEALSPAARRQPALPALPEADASATASPASPASPVSPGAASVQDAEDAEKPRMRPRGLQPGSAEMILRALVQAQQHSRAAELLRAIANAGADLPGDSIMNGVVDAAVRARAYSEAWEVLELLLLARRRADKYWVSILTKSLETATDRRAVRRGIALVDKFIEQQHGDVDEIVFNSLLNVLGQIGDMVKLEQTLHRMQEYNVPPSAVTYGTVVKAYGRARDIDSVMKVWSDMRARCLGVNPVTCGCVLDACVKCGHFDKARAIFQEMKHQGLHKNTVLYATLIKGLAKSHDLMGAIQLYNEMRVEGVLCNLVTYNSLMDVCVRVNDLQTAAFFLQEMTARDIKPDLITFSTLIKGYAHAGQMHKALELAQVLKDRGLKCDEIMYNSLIDGCAKAKSLPEGLVVFEEMLQSRVTPSNITFSILVRLYFEAGQVEQAFKLIEEMGSRYRCAPNRVVYTVLLRCCSSQGGKALESAATLLGDLAGKRNSKMPDQGMIGAVLNGCAQHGELDLGVRLVHNFVGGAGASGGASRRAVTGGGVAVPLDGLKALFEAMGAHGDDARAQELAHFLRQKGLPTATVGQLHASLAEGRRNPGGVPRAAAAGATPMNTSYAAGTTYAAPHAGAHEAAAAMAAASLGYGGVGFDPVAMANQYAAVANQYAAAANPYAAAYPYAAAANPYAAAAYPYAAAVNPYAAAANPYAALVNPYAALVHPYAAAVNPYAVAANPYAAALLGMGAYPPTYPPVLPPYNAGAAAHCYPSGYPPMPSPLTMPPYLGSTDVYAAAAASATTATAHAQLGAVGTAGALALPLAPPGQPVLQGLPVAPASSATPARVAAPEWDPALQPMALQPGAASPGNNKGTCAGKGSVGGFRKKENRRPNV